MSTIGRDPRVFVSGVPGEVGLVRTDDGFPIFTLDERGNVGIAGRVFTTPEPSVDPEVAAAEDQPPVRQ